MRESVIRQTVGSSVDLVSGGGFLSALTEALAVCFLAIGGSLLMTCGLCAQTTARPQFDVASVKPAAPNSTFQGIKFSPGMIEVRDWSMKELIAYAWRVRSFQVLGGPPWLDSAHYDIAAKPETGSKRGEVNLMVQSLLEDRFQLTLHRETKELPIYALVMARKDHKPGPQLLETKEGSCVQRDETVHPAPPEPGQQPPKYCGQTNVGSRHVRAVSIPIGTLAGILSTLLGRRVLDETGLTGTFDVILEWTPDDTRAVQLASGGLPPAGKKAGDAGASFPPLLAALDEQLGLRLDSRKGPTEILVIDRVEKPSQN